MMYLMCLFKVLPHSDIQPVSESDLPLSPISPLSPESEITASVSSSLLESAKQSGVCRYKVCLHNENMPMQYIEFSEAVKTENFQ